jgi:D-alanyl-D-alanine carboxypeptidase
MRVLLDDWLVEAGAPGAVLGIRLLDGGTAVVPAGRTDDAGGFELEPGHRFRIGSITKTFVATLLVQLSEDGLLDLDDLLADHLPAVPHGQLVTVRQLLQHTSGIPDFGALEEYRQGLLRNPGRTWQPQETLELVADLPLDFEPGSRWAYSNTNYVLAGLVAEAVSERPLAALLREHILGPLGLESTFLENLEPAPPLETSGHYDIDGDGRAENVRIIPYTALVTSGAAAGGLSASALDVLDFGSGLFDGELLSEEGLATLIATSAVSAGYGLGMARYERRGIEVWGHAGGLPGFTAFFAHAPGDGVTVVALVNQTGVDVTTLVERSFALARGMRTEGWWSSSRGGSRWGAPAPVRPREHCDRPSQPCRWSPSQ